MSPLDYLQETLASIEKTLTEALRFDYGPKHSDEFFEECGNRLKEIGKAIALVNAGDAETILSRLQELENLGAWIGYIERSHLGEFSWPFADHMRRVATAFLSDTTLSGDVVKPIIHIVSDGGGYRIINERRVPSTTVGQRFAIIVFPRHLKHSVLLHPLFGHELGHTAILATSTGAQIKGLVAAALFNSTPILSTIDLTSWLHNTSAPTDVQTLLSLVFSRTGQQYVFPQNYLQSWSNEFICDLFGLLLFGPAFIAAHKALLRPSEPHPYIFNPFEPTHPPYATRHKMLVKANRILGWDIPSTPAGAGELYLAERELISYISDDPYDAWADLFSDANLISATNELKTILAPHKLGYEPTSLDEIQVGLTRIRKGVPPLIDTIDALGNPLLSAFEFSQIIYIGWVYWIGKQHLTGAVPDSFLQTNQLCNQALVQQVAINTVLNAKVTF